MSINLYPEYIHTGVVEISSNDNDEIDSICTTIYKATKGLGTDCQKLVKAIGSLNCEYRENVCIRYRTLYGKTLKNVIKHEQGKSDFGVALQLLVVSNIVHAECDMIHMACKGIGSGFGTSITSITTAIVSSTITNTYPDYRLLLSILCGRSNSEIQLVKTKFKEVYDIELIQFIISEINSSSNSYNKKSDLELFVSILLEGKEEVYNPTYHDEIKATNEIQFIHRLRQDKWINHDNVSLFKIICYSPPQYIQLLNELYNTQYKEALVSIFEKEFSGHLQLAISYTIQMKVNPYQQCCSYIKLACRGFGTDELLLTCCLIRYQCIIRHLLKTHITLYNNKTIRDRILSETSGFYKSLLMEIIETGEVSL